MWKPQQDKYYELKSARVPKYRVKFEGAYQLSDVPGYVWFSPAAIYLWGAFTDAQLYDVLENQPGIKFFWYTFDRPVFDSFKVGDDTGWDHTLWAVSAENWAGFVDRMLEMALMDSKREAICTYALQSLTLIDPLFSDKKSIVSRTTPSVTVYSFAVLTSKHQIAFTKLDWRAGVLPKIGRMAAGPRERRLARKLYSSRTRSADLFDRYKQELLLEGEQDYARKLKEMLGGR
jgi:hypothetical protein